MGPLCALHDSSVAHSSIAVGSVLLIVLLVYGAIPGSLQELIPRDSLASTEVVEFQLDDKPHVRTIPSLASLEFPSIPHAAASWGKGSDRFSVFLMRPGLAAWISGLIAIALVLWDIRQRASTHRWAGLGLTVFCVFGFRSHRTWKLA